MSADTQTTLRDAHKDLTRQRVLAAALDMLREGQGEALTVAAVAHRAGVTERTIYRHFESREALMAAMWEKVNEAVKTPVLPQTAAELVAQPREMFPEFDRQAELMRAIVTTKQGRELRLSVNAERTARMRKAVRAVRPDLDESALTRLCAAVQLLDSSFA